MCICMYIAKSDLIGLYNVTHMHVLEVDLLVLNRQLACFSVEKNASAALGIL